ncbi:MAG: hypothetical protein Q9163_002399 [Psora crenata]
MITRLNVYPKVLTKLFRFASILGICCASISKASLLTGLEDPNHIIGHSSFDLPHQQSLHLSKDAPRADTIAPYDNQDVSLLSGYASLLDALEIMQSHFFEVSHGIWPQAIDWTAAVLSTQISATLAAITEFSQSSSETPQAARDQENLINRYFTQIASFYFGENAFSLRTQAYDDMLWVVLDWLESIKFINLHSSLHYTERFATPDSNTSTWYARQFIPQFAHRARLFYDIASRGWDSTLCGGGMIWNPYLTPYKNAITNQLYIAASVSMYLYFPGDDNPSPFHIGSMGERDMPPAKAHDKRYLNKAIEGYQWLKNSGMRNKQGLYADGFHIRGWRGGRDGSNGTGECDLRDEKVYTYNQGVLLSGLRGLWEATGSSEYLEDGHELIRNVITATGFEQRGGHRQWRWAGLGRNGIIEDACDWSGTCSQNGQTFKGIFFHHFTIFCTPLPLKPRDHDRPWLGDDEIHTLHRQSCDGYATWVSRNAKAAYMTRNHEGEFGEWWGHAARRTADDDESYDYDERRLERPASQGTDYRNEGVPNDEVWRLQKDDDIYETRSSQNNWRDITYERPAVTEKGPCKKDINDRGRGRTVETQSGGLAVIRAAWKLARSRGEGY